MTRRIGDKWFDAALQASRHAEPIRLTSTSEIIKDAKDYRTEQYRIKRAILTAMGLQIREIERTRTRAR